MRKAALLFLLLPQLAWGEKLKVLLPVWCEGKATEVEVVVFLAGGQAAFDPLWAEKPLARAKVKPWNP